MPKILIVDDVPSNIKVLIQALKNPEYDILAATNGPDALAIAVSERPDLILLVMRFVQSLKKIKKQNRFLLYSSQLRMKTKMRLEGWTLGQLTI